MCTKTETARRLQAADQGACGPEVSALCTKPVAAIGREPSGGQLPDPAVDALDLTVRPRVSAPCQAGRRTVSRRSGWEPKGGAVPRRIGPLAASVVGGRLHTLGGGPSSLGGVQLRVSARRIRMIPFSTRRSSIRAKDTVYSGQYACRHSKDGRICASGWKCSAGGHGLMTAAELFL